jgi:DNA modification methylase
VKIIYLNPSEVLPYQNNPRINEKAVDGVMASLQEFGFQQPVVVDTEHVIIVGHTRWKAALKLNLPSIPILVAENLSPDQVKAYRLADNKTAEASDWDYTKLIDEIAELTVLDIDATLSGFSEKEIQEILGMNETTMSGMVDDDETPDPEDVEHRVKPGDVWVLGDHRLVCGDATVPNSYEIVMARPDEHADIVLTDPPYNVDYEGEAGKIQNDNMGDLQFRTFLTDSFKNLTENTKEGGVVYVFHADTEGINFRTALAAGGFEQKQTLVWNKNSAVMGRQDYNWKHEPIMYGWKPGAAHYFNKDFKQTTVIDHPRPTKSKHHPTMKPVDLLVLLLQNSSVTGDVVLDAFGGSGSTLIAAAKTGRKARVIELDPKFCDVILERWEAWSGEKAVRMELEAVE